MPRKKQDKLPATFVEADGIEAVRRWFPMIEARMAASFSPKWLEDTAVAYLQQGLLPTLDMIKAAREDYDMVADKALRRAGAEMLDRGEMPPAALRAYCEEALVQAPVSRGAGAHTKYDHWMRNIGIAMLVGLVDCRFAGSIRPTRSQHVKPKPDRGPSSCSIVHVVVGPAYGIDETRVQNIWAGLAGQLARFLLTSSAPGQVQKFTAIARS